jgi:hypothetical protein
MKVGAITTVALAQVSLHHAAQHGQQTMHVLSHKRPRRRHLLLALAHHAQHNSMKHVAAENPP